MTNNSHIGLKIFVAILSLVIGFCGMFVGYCFANKPKSDVFINGDLKIHFLELGTKYTGDCIYIQCGNLDIIVDGGAEKYSPVSVNKIYDYISPKMNDNVMDFAIITHAHEDHYACFSTYNTDSLFDKFNIGTIIDFPKTDQKETTDKGNPTLYSHYVDEREQAKARGAKHFTALECWNNSKVGAQRVYEFDFGIKLEILYNYYYEHSAPGKNENFYSVCFQIVHGDKYFLFTGDLEEQGEKKLVEYNNLHRVELFKAGHHGSDTSSSDALLSVIQPKICAVTCVAGTPEYTDNKENQFPYQTFINNISKYTDKVYVTSQATDVTYNPSNWNYASLNGNIVVTSNANGVSVNCSNNNTILKDSTWFNDAKRIWLS